MRGFTLVELLLVVGMMAILASFVAPVSTSFFQAQALDETAAGVLDTLRRAHAHALFQKNDSDFGVRFLSGSYVLFQGASYDARVQAQDETFDLPAGTAISGTPEVMFVKRSGAASSTGYVTVTAGNASTTIFVSSAGVIERQ